MIENLLEIRKRLLSSPILPAQKRLFTTAIKRPTCSTAKISDSESASSNESFEQPCFSDIELDSELSVTSRIKTSVIETDGELLSNVNERIQMQSVDLPSDQSPILIHKAELPFCFSSGTSLDPCELLFYACLITEFQEKAFKYRSYDKYENVSRVIDIVYKRKYSTVSMRNFIYRKNNGVGHGLGKEKGRIRWYFYCEYISKLIEEHKIVIASLLSKPNQSFSSLEITKLTGFIDQLCCSAKKFLAQENGIIDDETKLDNKIVDSQMKAILKTFDSWSYLLDGSNDILHLYYFRKSRNLQIYPDLEILVENNGRWQLMLEGKLRKISLE